MIYPSLKKFSFTQLKNVYMLFELQDAPSWHINTNEITGNKNTAE